MKTKPKPSQVANFKCSKYEFSQIDAITARAVKMAKEDAIDYSKTTAMMDITACHCNGCPLDLAKLMAADDFTFAHDVYGIRRHIDRVTGQLGGYFLPRTALPETT